MTGRLGACALLVAATLSPGVASALTAGASSIAVEVPAGVPLAGYGSPPRRAWMPDVLGRHPYAFWFRPSTGVHDPVRVRALALDGDGARLLWLSMDVVGIDPTLVSELRARLARLEPLPPTIVLSASHTHSGPGAFAESAFWGFLAADREAPAVRKSLADALESAGREAWRRREPARVVGGKGTVTGVATSRLDQPLDPELGVLKVTADDGRPIALVWNYAIHGTALGRGNFQLSGDLMGDASARLERETGVPVLFVNGAAGDVSPAAHGWPAVDSIGSALAAAATTVWRALPAGRDEALSLAERRITLPEPAVSIRNCLGRWVPRRPRVNVGRALPTSAALLGIRIGATVWVTVPGELQTALGLDIKGAGAGRFEQTFVAGYSNDYLGYFLTRRDYDRPSYVACGSFYGERGGEVIRDAAVELVHRLAGTRPGG
ncbi:MAG TPA: neutral/alkaline non-lysosomal ceramidase N-terminal domain-containing protein [Candidatus Bathyarchaeia archaeon]|nr:neutral/alkaline non-lysosomal ceramidase N-terminal domain-containing protein [Candidatus Bathyarchaeia archaeon]